VIPLIINCIERVQPCKTSLNTSDWLNTLMSLFEPATPKYVCQIHKSCDVMTSSIIVGFLWLPLRYWSYHTIGQFFHSQWIQSIEPNIIENLHAFPICSRRLMLLLLGLLRCSSPNISFTPFTKASKHSTAVLSPILTYSSTLYVSDPYANIWIVVVPFYNGKRPILPYALDLNWKYG